MKGAALFRKQYNQWLMVKKVITLIGLFLFLNSTAEDHPNILLITADDMNWNSVGVYNSTIAGTTPNIDKLASQGMKFDYAYVQMAMCTPSRQVMLSGSHSHQTMTRGFTEIERVGPALPDILKQNGGYFIANINKEQDFYDWDVALTENETASGRDIPYQKKAVAGIINEAGNKPWFIMMNFNDPHRPFYNSEAENNSENYQQFENRMSKPGKVFSPEEVTVPGFLPDLPDIRKEMAEYYSSVRRCDDGVGAVLDAVESAGQEENTIVVFMSDHGISMPYAKLNCYQTSLRVPLIFRYPGKIEKGSRNDKDLVSAVDLTPTLLELIGMKVPEYMAGRSFKPLLEGKEQKKRDYTIGYYYRNLRQDNMFPEFTVQMRDWVYIYNPWVIEEKEVHNSDYTHSLTLAAIWETAVTNRSIKERSEFHKYRTMEELYNVRQDPHSYINLAYDVEYAERVKDMRQILVGWMEETEHPAVEVMKEPYNKELIAEYMEWEKLNAQEQIEQIMKFKRQRNN
jgi:N-sulfoglucosamine sulfohydrolase